MTSDIVENIGGPGISKRRDKGWQKEVVKKVDRVSRVFENTRIIRKYASNISLLSIRVIFRF